MTTVTLIGYGYWGRNVARAMRESGFVVQVSDTDPEALKRARDAGYGIAMKQLNTSTVAICTPPDLHSSLVLEALSAGKHVWVEKPIAQSDANAVRLARMAQEREQVLFVDHTFVHAPAVNVLANSIDGQITHVEAARTHLCKPRPGTDVIEDLLPHDISILLHCRLRPGMIRVEPRRRDLKDALVEIKFLDGANALAATGTIYLSWASTFKQRRMTFYGTVATYVYDHLQPHAPVTIYTSYSEERNAWSQGPIHCPAVSAQEPLMAAVAAFKEALEGGQPGRFRGAGHLQNAMRVQQIVTAARMSDGKWIELDLE